ncbi:MAG: thioredoxin domain-containing protein [Myxococcales bacterium]|nr:thioredoxin domain-containing protein [Myxococcales bacterium]
MRRRFPFIFLLGLSAVGATCQGRQAPEKFPPPKLDVEQSSRPAPTPAVIDLQGVDMTKVPAIYRADALRILNENFCYCGCTRTVAACLSNRDACSCVECSERVAQFVVEEYANGRSTADVENNLVALFSEAYNATPHTFETTEHARLGPESAPYTIVEFADFQCPHCRIAFGELVSFVQSRSDVQLLYYHFPLSHMGPKSLMAAKATEAARQQGQFWQMAELIYQNQRDISEARLNGYAQQIGLDMKKYAAAMANSSTEKTVLADRELGSKLGITGTPTVFVNGRPLGTQHDPRRMSLRLDMEKHRTTCQ